MDKDTDMIYGLVVGVLYVVAVGIQVWMVVDEVTDGALSTDVKARWHRATARLRDRRTLDRQVREGAPWVIWEAHQALDTEGAP